MNGNQSRATGWRVGLRFSLRSLVLVMLLAAIALGVFSWGLRRARRQAPAVATLREFGAHVRYDHEEFFQRASHVSRRSNVPKPPTTKPSPFFPSWLVEKLGIDFFHDVIEVHCEQSRRLSDHEVERFWQAIAALPKLQRLEASGGLTRPGSVERLERHDRLESLALRWADLAPCDYSVLHQLDRLCELNLSDTPVTDECLSKLASHRTLRRLDLHNAKITDAGIQHLAGLPQLERLWLSCTQVGDAGMAHLRGHPSLNDLDLAYTKITDAALAHLATMPRLAELDLTRTTVTEKGLAELEGHAALSYLNLELTEIEGAGFASLADLPNLKELCMYGAYKPSDISFLAQCPHLERLKIAGVLNLTDSLEQLVIPAVIELGNGRTGLSDEELLRLAAVPKLKAIHFGDYRVPTPAALAQFRKLQPNCPLIQGSSLTQRGLRSRP